MGGSTFLIGCMPTYSSFSFAPYLILILRLLQGLALGGEYGGAATYVAEHAPEGKRGYYTSWIQTTATLGLFVSLIVIITVQKSLSKEAYNQWGWRLPFLLSIFLVIVSIVIRMKMNESPLFSKLKSEGKTSTNPLKESFGNKANMKMVLLALFGATMGQGVVWYTGQFYAQTFLIKTCGLEATQTNTWIGIALLLVTPFFVVFGWLSDKIGRKGIMLTGMLLAVICYRPIFKNMYEICDTKNKIEATSTIITTKKINPNKAKDSLVVKTSNIVFTDSSKLLLTETYSLEKLQINNNTPVDTSSPQQGYNYRLRDDGSEYPELTEESLQAHNEENATQTVKTQTAYQIQKARREQAIEEYKALGGNKKEILESKTLGPIRMETILLQSQLEQPDVEPDVEPEPQPARPKRNKNKIIKI
jgi:MFS family permease